MDLLNWAAEHWIFSIVLVGMMFIGLEALIRAARGDD